ncbi:hypothetical protein CMEL01_02684 [Colletotrichum melonis]|uniref:Uncharacterized protein n=1 Tax=Colletotrichum melonis TaxID=1209925 RepID=A0AAI9XTB7_9PEZI|nr:hypothetical protein CMEL01_02684 [Colletotrichum melonis]
MTTQPPSSTHMARSRLNRQIRGCETTIFLLHGVSRTRAQKKHAASSACFPFFSHLYFPFSFLFAFTFWAMRFWDGLQKIWELDWEKN